MKFQITSNDYYAYYVIDSHRFFIVGINTLADQWLANSGLSECKKGQERRERAKLLSG